MSGRAALRGLATVLCLLPASIVPLFVARYATPVPTDDIWNQVQVLEGGAYDHSVVRWLLAPHNEHRVPVTRAVLYLLDRATRMNLRAEALCSAALLLLGVLVLWRASPPETRSPLWFLPVPWLVLTLRAQENLLKSFQLHLHACLLAMFLAWALLSDGRIPRRRLALAVVLAVAGSFCFGSGLLVWPVGLLQLAWLARGAPWRPLARAAAAWCAAGALTIAGYFFRYHPHGEHRHPAGALGQPLRVLDFALTMLGGPFVASDVPAARIAALLVLLLVAGALIGAWRARRGGPGFSLLLFGLADCLLISASRANGAMAEALLSRYAVLSAMVPVGAFLLLAGALAHRRRGAVVWLLLLVPLGWGTARGWSAGLGEARAYRERVAATESLLRTIDTQPDEQVRALGGDPLSYRIYINYLRCHRLSIFRNDAGPPPPMVFGGATFSLDYAAGLEAPLTGKLRLAGWAYDAIRRGPAAGVLLRIDGERTLPLRYGLPSPDVAAGRHDEQLRNVRFDVDVPAAALGRGEHTLRFRVLGTDGCAVFDPDTELRARIE